MRKHAVLILFPLVIVFNLSCNGGERGDDGSESPRAGAPAAFPASDAGSPGAAGLGQVVTAEAPPSDDETSGETPVAPGKLSDEQKEELLIDPLGIGAGFIDDLEYVMRKFARGHKEDEAFLPSGKRWRVALSASDLKYLDRNTDQQNVIRLHGKIGETRKPLDEIGIAGWDKSSEERIFLLLGGISDSSSVADIVSLLGPLPAKLKGNLSDHYFVEYVFTIPHPGNSNRTSMISVRFNISDAGEIRSLFLKAA